MYALVRRARGLAALTLVALVVSHWVLDVVTHRPDMPLTLNGPARLGLGLWFSIPATLAVEFVLFGAGLAVYLRATSARDRIGSIGLWTLVAFLLVIYLAAAFGPPPPSRDRRRLVRPGVVAARRLGLLGGQSPHASPRTDCGIGSWTSVEES